MVSVIGKEMVPYNGNLHNDNSSSQSSTSSIVIESSSPTVEDSNAVARLSDFNNSSDSELSFAHEMRAHEFVNKPKKLALLPSSEGLLFSLEDIEVGSGTLDSASIKEILTDHKCYPPQHANGDPEHIPATREKLNYFLKVLQLKLEKYKKLSNCIVPDSLSDIPLASSYEAFIKAYWPGAMSCCKKLFNTPQKYSDHYYKYHAPQLKIPSPPLNLSCVSAMALEVGMNEVEILSKTPSASSSSTAQLVVGDQSDSSSDIVSLSGETSYKSCVTSQSATNFQQTIASQKPPSNDNQNLVERKRKTLCPTSRPGPLSHKQVKLNQTIANIESSLDSGDEKTTNRPKRARKRFNSQNALDNQSEEQMEELERDQMKYEPQHLPGAPENFVANVERLKYFSEVLALKLSKYGHMNMPRQTPSSSHIPLALSLAGFMQYYWPGKVICCGLMRENCQLLEKHITRSHRPPKPGPNMSVVMSQVDKNAFDDETTDMDVHQTKITNFLQTKVAKNETSDKPSLKSPPGFQADQHKYPPQHKPGEPEDFCANQESIDYFIEILTIKREKYAQMAPIKEKPLSSNWKDFVLHYWPGMMDCCDHVFASCKDYQSHFSSSHLPPKKMPRLKVIDASDIPTKVPAPQNETVTATFTNTAALGVSSVSPRTSRSSPRNQRVTDRLSLEPTPSRNETYSQSLSLLSTPSHLLMINSIFDEARQLKSRTGQVMSMSALLPLLERLLELVASIANRIRGTMEVESISQATECLDYVWTASKMAILRWEDLKGRSNCDTFLNAVQFAYGTLPVFTSWEQRKHLEMLENVVLLSLNTVKNWQPPPSSPEAKLTSRQQSSVRRRSSKPPRMADLTLLTNGDPSEDKVEMLAKNSAAAAATSTSDAPVDTGKDGKKKISNAVLDFCRLVNISTWQNTKARSLTGYKDDNGEYNAVYRYGIGKAINLYCPPDVTHLKCCGKVFKLSDLKTHVSQKHEAYGQSNRTEPSISPA